MIDTDQVLAVGQYHTDAGELLATFVTVKLPCGGSVYFKVRRWTKTRRQRPMYSATVDRLTYLDAEHNPIDYKRTRAERHHQRTTYSGRDVDRLAMWLTGQLLLELYRLKYSASSVG